MNYDIIQIYLQNENHSSLFLAIQAQNRRRLMHNESFNLFEPATEDFMNLRVISLILLLKQTDRN